jgi:hypothetical protein
MCAGAILKVTESSNDLNVEAALVLQQSKSNNQWARGARSSSDQFGATFTFSELEAGSQLKSDALGHLRTGRLVACLGISRFLGGPSTWPQHLSRESSQRQGFLEGL